MEIASRENKKEKSSSEKTFQLNSTGMLWTCLSGLSQHPSDVKNQNSKPQNSLARVIHETVIYVILFLVRIKASTCMDRERDFVRLMNYYVIL